MHKNFSSDNKNSLDSGLAVYKLMQNTEWYLFAEMLTVADIPSITGQALQGRTLFGI